MNSQKNGNDIGKSVADLKSDFESCFKKAEDSNSGKI